MNLKCSAGGRSRGAGRGQTGAVLCTTKRHTPTLIAKMWRPRSLIVQMECGTFALTDRLTPCPLLKLFLLKLFLLKLSLLKLFLLKLSLLQRER
jgi:hypothetical protein